MGLDMYLYARRDLPSHWVPENADSDDVGEYISGWEFGTPDARRRYSKLLADAQLGKFASEDTPSAYLIKKDEDSKPQAQVCVAYWRKANSIHNWFVEKVQAGIDECQLSEVSRDQLKQLLASVQEAIAAYQRMDKDQIREVLPPKDGFFFGDVDINEYYLDDLQETIRQIEPLLEAPEDVVFYYQSSW
jgi:CRISPR/Cas system-associated endoribonuclease Cas2